MINFCLLIVLHWNLSRHLIQLFLICRNLRLQQSAGGNACVRSHILINHNLFSRVREVGESESRMCSFCFWKALKKVFYFLLCISVISSHTLLMLLLWLWYQMSRITSWRALDSGWRTWSPTWSHTMRKMLSPSSDAGWAFTKRGDILWLYIYNRQAMTFKLCMTVDLCMT